MKPINLLPPEIKGQRKSRRQNVLLMVAFGVVLAGLAAVWGVRAVALANQNERTEQAEAASAKLRPKVAALAEFGQMDDTIKRKGGVLAQSMTNDIGWSRLLKELAATMPADSWLTGFQASSEAAALAGGVPQAAAPAVPSGAAGQTATAAPAAGSVAAPVVPLRWGTANFTGVTFDFPGVATWITKMQTMKSFSNVFVPSATKAQLGGREVANFTGTIDLNTNVASGRYQQPVQITGAPAASVIEGGK